MNTIYNTLIERYETGSELLLPVIAHLSNKQILFKPSEKEWSIREIMMHLIDSETNGSLRIRMAIAENASVYAYDQDAWTKNLLYQTDTTSFSDVINLLKIIHTRTAALLRRIPEEYFESKFIMHPENGKMMLKDVLQMYAEHVEIHVRQIERVKKQFAKKSSDWIK